MNFLSAAERLAAMDHSGVVLHPEACLHAMDKFSTCQACETICPADAIQAGKPPSLDAEKCQSCLACLPVCPTGAFRADDAIPDLLNCAARLETESIELLCEHNSLPDKGLIENGVAIRMRGCLAGIGSGGYLTLFTLGLEEVVVRNEACAECPWGALKSQIESHIATTQRLLSAWDRDGALRASGPLETKAIVERPVWEAGNPPLSRRDLFRLATRQSQMAAARVLSKDHSDKGKHPSRDRQRILAAIDHLPEPSAGGKSISLEGMGFATLSISKECTACGVCARACPSGALQFATQDDLYYQVNFNPGICIGCEACTVVCRVGAIQVQTAPSFEQVFGSRQPDPLISGELARCEHCQTLYAVHSGSRLCPLCEFRQKNPFGSTFPPSYKGKLPS